MRLFRDEHCPVAWGQASLLQVLRPDLPALGQAPLPHEHYQSNTELPDQLPQALTKIGQAA